MFCYVMLWYVCMYLFIYSFFYVCISQDGGSTGFHVILKSHDMDDLEHIIIIIYILQYLYVTYPYYLI